MASPEHTAPAACPHPTIKGADSQDAAGQLLTAPTLDTSPAPCYLPCMGPPWVSCLGHAKRLEGVVEVKELVRRWGGVRSLEGACLQQEVALPGLQLYPMIITFTILRQLTAHAQAVPGDHVVCVPSITSTTTLPSLQVLCVPPGFRKPDFVSTDVVVLLKITQSLFRLFDPARTYFAAKKLKEKQQQRLIFKNHAPQNKPIRQKALLLHRLS